MIDRRADLRELRELAEHHPIWRNRLFRACEQGLLGRDDFRIVFAQYLAYSRDFTRYLCGLMANLEDDLLRARLAENLWEEGGGADPAERHAELFRGFLARGLGVDLATIAFLPEAREFARGYLDVCRRADPITASAFLALGTEAIVPRMYGIFVRGLIAAGIAEEHLRFFRIHMACDDAHAATLEEIVLHYGDRPGWFDTCRDAVIHALDARTRFFEALFARCASTRRDVADAGAP